MGRILGTAGIRYGKGLQYGFGKSGENLGSLFQTAVEKFQRRGTSPPWFSTHTPEQFRQETVSRKQTQGNKETSPLRDALHSTFGKEGRLSDLLSKVDVSSMVTSGTPRIRFQNQGAFAGNFEEQGKVFRFQSVSPSLSEKIREDRTFPETSSGWEIIDFRTSDVFSEKKPDITLVVPSSDSNEPDRLEETQDEETESASEFEEEFSKEEYVVSDSKEVSEKSSSPIEGISSENLVVSESRHADRSDGTSSFSSEKKN